MTAQTLLLRAQIALIRTLARVWGSLLVRLGQPAVIGKILLGPGLLGWLAPAAIQALLNSRGLTQLIVLHIGLKQGIMAPLVCGLFVGWP